MDLWHLASILIVINILFALSSGKKIVCSHCGKKLELEQADKEELEKYGEINFTCPNCGKESTYDGSDNEEEEWTCEHCEEPLVLTDDEQKKLDRENWVEVRCPECHKRTVLEYDEEYDDTNVKESLSEQSHDFDDPENNKKYDPFNI